MEEAETMKCIPLVDAILNTWQINKKEETVRLESHPTDGMLLISFLFCEIKPNQLHRF